MHTDFLQTLQSTYGPVMDARSICKVLHYPTVSALQAAKTRGKLPFRTVEFEGRKGLFAATAEVARYLEQKLNPASENSEQSNTSTT